MGNTKSSLATPDKHVFAKELSKLNTIVNAVISEKNVFKNRDYNFLSQDVCNEHYLLMENELNRHLKVNLEGLGESLYLIPKEEGPHRVNKKEICQRISNHYIKILYVLCLIKYVYNIENDGDLSISGIVFRNIRVIDNIMEISFCNVPHKDYSKNIKDAYKLDFSKLEGLDFLANYFLDPDEGNAFVRLLRRVLARSPKKNVEDKLCDYVNRTHLTADHMKALESMFEARYKDKLKCQQKPHKASQGPKTKVNLTMYVEKDNPIFSRDHCYEMHKYVIQLNTTAGKAVAVQYERMKSNYLKNIKEVEKLLDGFVMRQSDGSYTLKDISSKELDDTIKKVKEAIKIYYLQSIVDFQSLLDIGKSTPNINVLK